MNLYVRFVYTTIHINAKINYVSSSFEFYVLRCPWEITNKSNQHLYENVTFVMNQTDNNDNNKMRLEMCTNCCIIVVWMQTHQWQIQNKKFFSNCHHQELDGPEEEENVFFLVFFFFSLMWHTNSISNVHIFGLLLGVC